MSPTIPYTLLCVVSSSIIEVRDNNPLHTLPLAKLVLLGPDVSSSMYPITPRGKGHGTLPSRRLRVK
jgi:hypothetical protein